MPKSLLARKKVNERREKRNAARAVVQIKIKLRNCKSRHVCVF